MSEAVERGLQVANPLTGELLTIANASDRDLADYLVDVRELESSIREHKSLVNRELLARMDRNASWTLPAGDWKLSAPSPATGEEWDGAGLYAALCDLSDSGVITMDAVNLAVTIEHVYKVRAVGVKALRKLPGVGQVVDRFCTEAEPKQRYVSVKPNA